MRHLAVYLLLVVGGNASPSAKDVSAVLTQSGIDVDESRLEQLVSELDGKSLTELVTLGREHLYVGGGAPAAAGAAPAGK